MSTRRQVQIDAIAATLAVGWDYDDFASPTAYAKHVNETGGWTIDVRYGHEAPGNWTRTEGIVLDDDELIEAVDLADALLG